MKFAHSLLAGAALAVSMSSVASAADLLINAPVDPIYDSPLFNFEGLYVGGTAGGAVSGGSLYGTLGVVVGANFAVTDGIIAGVEFQGDSYWNGGLAGFDALALGRVGGFLSENTLLYADLGTGFLDGNAVYALGGGAEMGVTSNLGVRGDLQILGQWGGGPDTAKATVGLVWHLN